MAQVVADSNKGEKMKTLVALFATASLLLIGCSSHKGGTAEQENSSTGAGYSGESSNYNSGMGTNSYPTENQRP
jgi:hypothetical protein